MDRLDIYLVKNNLVKSRERAKEFIKEGCVKVDGIVIEKPSLIVSDENEIIIAHPYNYVSRGGVKLYHLIEEGIITFQGLNVLDIGASTGGFTEVALRDGAKSVVALDVGRDQLDSSLRNNPRVVVMEGTDIRDAKFNNKFESITIDVSFISIIKVLPKVFSLIEPKGFICALLKPQFEAGLNKRKGLYNDIKLHKKILNEIELFLRENDFYINYISPSPIRGGSGNIEYISVISKEKTKADINEAINNAFKG